MRGNRHFNTSSTTNCSHTTNYHLLICVCDSQCIPKYTKQKKQKTKPMGWPNQKKLKKQNKPNPWHGRDLGGWGVSFCFFGFLEVFQDFHQKYQKPMKQKNKKNKGWTRSGGLGCVIFLFFFGFLQVFGSFDGSQKKHSANMLFNVLIITSAFEFFDNHSLNPSGKAHFCSQFCDSRPLLLPDILRPCHP